MTSSLTLSESPANPAVTTWLIIVCLVIVAMVAVGGATRLTQSGLSMVDWKPISGVIPPINETEWQAEFDKYKAYPEYQKLNRGMSLDEFKGIFYWEYGHRVLGRSIGIIFFVPFVVFLMRKRLPEGSVPWLTGALVLGGMQGLMGWYMVKSGLVDKPHVSHFRLAAHLSLAMLILAYLFWIILWFRQVPRIAVSTPVRVAAWSVLALLTLQIVYGAFVAGLDAGKGFNTWPMMDQQFMAEAAVMMQPAWVNLFENGAMIQFVHRWVGALLLLSVIGYVVLVTYSVENPLVRNAAIAMVAATLVQFGLGVATLLNYVPISLAIAHQVFACVLLCVAVFSCYCVRK